METFTCPWCGQRNLIEALDCRKCGGPLPSLGKDDPGPTPPLPPRQLPGGYRRRMLITNAPTNLVGGIFLLVGLPIAVIFPVIGLATSMWLFMVIGCSLGGLFAVIGGLMLYFGVQNSLGKIRPYEMGQAKLGEITDIYSDQSIAVSGRHPWRVVYHFDVNGFGYEGSVLTWQNVSRMMSVGKRVYILYMVEHPEQNVIYPPI